MKIWLTAIAALSTLASGVAHARPLPSFSDKGLSNAVRAYAALATEAPAASDYAFKLDLGTAQAQELLRSGKLADAIGGAIVNELCIDVDAYTCPDTFDLELIKGSSFESVSPSIQAALSYARNEPTKSEAFYDLSDALTDFATDNAATVVARGSESNSFGASELLVAVSLETGEVLVIGSGYAE